MRDEGHRDDVDRLPPDLSERVRVASSAPVRPDGAFVLVWMRTAARGHENPAIETALAMADRLDRPVFVYHGVSERYPYASDRHHRFLLEGARDVARELRERGIGYSLHVEREGHRGPVLRRLAERAAVVVTEEMPVPPLAAWTGRLARSSPSALWCVDTDCVVPMRLTRTRHERAFRFRDATERIRDDRIDRRFEDRRPSHAAFVPPDLPFEPVDPERADLDALVRACAIDHDVAPVTHSRGGARAGYERWRRFVGEGLARYADRRNDPLRDGVSRMSAYLHYGHVSPFRIAREAHAHGSSGARKFLDELLIWRELAHHFCFHTPELHDLSAVPSWAVDTLRAHEGDPRERLPDDDAFDRAGTGDALWDAAQRSLVVHGELHNNVRMTWGKAIVAWSPDAATALRRLIDLNHRYALDGRDPSSYGGLLWCLGQFDRPFKPEAPVFGTVRPRSTAIHARRLDPERYRRKVEQGPPVPARSLFDEA